VKVKAIRFAVPLLVFWSLGVWGWRVRNVLTDELVGFELAWRLGLAAAFVLLALWALRSAMVLWRDGASDWWCCVSGAVLSLAVLNLVVWPVRASQIAIGEWSTGFKVVHTLLAAVSVVLGLLVVFQRYGRAGHRRSVNKRRSVAHQV
jgi:hypothetical protein